MDEEKDNEIKKIILIEYYARLKGIQKILKCTCIIFQN